ncbi:MAG: hypothetical protein HUU20_09925 [Pirellulales bacterium]|nr:hypothetical protein [Pirellulales bacterium]
MSPAGWRFPPGTAACLSWRAAQVATVSFGSLGLVLVASLTWNLPLSSDWIHAGTWISLGLLLLHLTMVTVKIAQATGTRPVHEGTTAK